MSALAETLTPSIVEVGKIKIGELGVPRKTSDGNRTWRPPVKLDYFKVTTLYRDAEGQLLIDEPLMQSLAIHADKRDGKLRSIPIMFPSNDIDDIMQSTHVWYVGKKLGARRDGKRVTFFFDPSTGEPLAEPKTGAWDPAFLEQADPCDRSKKKKLFKRFTTLNVQIDAGMSRWGGLYKFRSCGEISARQLYGSLLVLRRAAAGALRGPVFRLVVRPMQVSPEGISTTVHVVHCEFVSNDKELLLKQAHAQAALEAATAAAVAESDRQLKQLIAASNNEPLDAEDDEPLVFNQTLKKVDGEVGADEMKPAPAISKEELATLCKAKGWGWNEVVKAIDKHWGTQHPENAGWSTVPAEQINDFAAWLRTEPDAPPAAVEQPTEQKPSSPEELAALFDEVDRLAVQVGGSWDAVRSEYAEGFGFAGTRVKELSPEQAVKFRDQLRLDLAAQETITKGAA